MDSQPGLRAFLDWFATLFEEVIATEKLNFKATDDVIRTVDGNHRNGAVFFSQMISASTKGCGVDMLCTEDQQAAQF